jgi:hypothetical protein
MTLEEKINRAWELLEFEAAELKESGGIAMKFIVENNEATEIVFVPEAEVINSANAKSLVAKHVREVVQKMGAHTVYHFSDSWTAEIRGIKEKPELLAEVNRIGTKRAEELGLLTRREALMCQITTRDGKGALLRWLYRRDEENSVITMEERDHKIGQVEGKFSHLFG